MFDDPRFCFLARWFPKRTRWRTTVYAATYVCRYILCVRVCVCVCACAKQSDREPIMNRIFVMSIITRNEPIAFQLFVSRVWERTFPGHDCAVLVTNNTNRTRLVFRRIKNVRLSYVSEHTCPRDSVTIKTIYETYLICNVAIELWDMNRNLILQTSVFVTSQKTREILDRQIVITHLYKYNTIDLNLKYPLF